MNGIKTKNPPIYNTSLNGLIYWPSRYYHNRYECNFYGRRGIEIRTWIRENWGDTDDMVWASGEDWFSQDRNYEYTAMITPQQLTLLLLKWG